MRFITAKDLYNSNPEPVKWICKPWLAAEAITVLDGKAKAAGKTTLALAMCKAILIGQDFLGEPTTKGAVVYLTEESTVTFRAALDRAEIGESEDFHVLFWRETHQMRDREDSSAWEQIVSDAIREAKKQGALLLVIDTFAQFARLTGDRENSAGDVLSAMLPIQKARDAGLAVLMNRHERKEGGSVGESGRGSSALTGAVDIILRLHRPPGNQSPNYRQLEALARFDDTPSAVTITWDAECGGYERIGESAAATTELAVAAIMPVLSEVESEASALKEIISRTGIKRSTLQFALELMVLRGTVGQIGEGKRGNAYKYYRVCAGTLCAKRDVPSGLEKTLQ